MSLNVSNSDSQDVLYILYFGMLAQTRIYTALVSSGALESQAPVEPENVFLAIAFAAFCVSAFLSRFLTSDAVLKKNLVAVSGRGEKAKTNKIHSCIFMSTLFSAVTGEVPAILGLVCAGNDITAFLPFVALSFFASGFPKVRRGGIARSRISRVSAVVEQNSHEQECARAAQIPGLALRRRTCPLQAVSLAPFQ